MKLLLALALIAQGLLLSGCYGLYGHDEIARYAERSDTITMSAGDAKEVNARTHMFTPWPRYVGDRNIPMNGARAVRAVQTYRSPPAAPAQGPSALVISAGAPPAGAAK